MPDAPALPPLMPSPELSMLAAPPLEPQLPDDPGFGAACGWVQDETELSKADAERCVLAAIQMQPQAWSAAAGAARSLDLPPAFRAAIHVQVAAEHGADAAAPLAVPEAAGLPASLDLPGGTAGDDDARGRQRSYAAAAAAAPPPRRSSRQRGSAGEWWSARKQAPAEPVGAQQPRSRAHSPSCRATGRGTRAQ